MLRLVLASASPRRRDLLTEAGFDFVVDLVKVSEIIDENLTPEDAVLTVARQKLDAVRALPKYSNTPGFLLLSADTVVVLGGTILGKPRSVDEAEQFLASLSAKTHRVMTACYLAPSGGGPGIGHVETSKVTFRDLSEEEIRDYVRTGEPMDKAGAYAIQGEGRKFVSRLDGSWSNVVGLPVEALEGLLKRHGWNVHRRKS